MDAHGLQAIVMEWEEKYRELEDRSEADRN